MSNIRKNKAKALSVLALSLIALTACSSGESASVASSEQSQTATATATSTSAITGTYPEGLKNDKDNPSELEKKSIETFNAYVNKVYEDKGSIDTIYEQMLQETNTSLGSEITGFDVLTEKASSASEETQASLAGKLESLYHHSSYFDYSGMSNVDKIELIFRLINFESTITSDPGIMSDFSITENSGIYQDSNGDVYLLGLGTKYTVEGSEPQQLPEETFLQSKITNNGEKISGQYWLEATKSLLSS